MSFLDDIYRGDQDLAVIHDDGPLVDQLRRRGMWVEVSNRTVYGKQTDAIMGHSVEIQRATRNADEAAAWDPFHGNEAEHVEVLSPIDVNAEAPDNAPETPGGAYRLCPCARCSSEA